MAGDSFAEKLGAVLVQPPPDAKAYQEALDVLKTVADAIGRQLGMAVELALGYSVNIGQQWNVVVKPPSVIPEFTLFRAYIPATGFPLSLDLWEDEYRQCQDKASLESTLLDFLGRPAIKTQLDSIRWLGDHRPSDQQTHPPLQ